LKKIAFITDELFQYDAISNYVCSLARVLSKSFAIVVFTFTLDRGLKIYLPDKDTSVNFYCKNPGRSFLAEIKTMVFPFRLLRELMKFDMQIILTERPPFVPVLFAKILRPRSLLVWDFHGITPPEYESTRRNLIDIFRLLIAKFLMKWCNYCIVHSHQMRREVKGLFNRDSVVIPLGIDLDRFGSKRVNQKFEACKHDKFTLLYVGRLVQHKRVDFLVRAIADLKDSSVNLLVVGDGPERNRLENYANSLGVASQIIFAGRVSDEELPYFYRRCDVFVTASRHEGVCLPILESFASGKPVIVPNVTAMPETAGDGGLLYTAESVTDFVRKIQLLKTDENLRMSLGKKALEIAASKSSDEILLKYAFLIESLMKVA
jgi:glycosyltransferase involved in cell wall biosynthesis